MSQQMCDISAAYDRSLKVLRSMKERALRFAVIVESSGWDICLEAKSILPRAFICFIMQKSQV